MGVVWQYTLIFGQFLPQLPDLLNGHCKNTGIAGMFCMG
jgi:hypothetical protein